MYNKGMTSMGKRKPRQKRAYLKRFSQATLNAGGYTPHKPTLKELGRRARSGVTTEYVDGEMARAVVVENIPTTRGVPIGLSPAEVVARVKNIHENSKTAWSKLTSWPFVFLKLGTRTAWKMFHKQGKYVLVKETYLLDKTTMISVSHPFSDRDRAISYYQMGEEYIAWEVVNANLHGDTKS
jgi:hypothetical protein